MSYRRAALAYISNICKRHFSDSGADNLGGLGSGAGKGGGSGGTIREAGGSLGKYGAAKEEEYFYKKRREQLEELNKRLTRRKRSCKSEKAGKQLGDIIFENRKRIAQLDKCFRKK